MKMTLQTAKTLLRNFLAIIALGVFVVGSKDAVGQKRDPSQEGKAQAVHNHLDQDNPKQNREVLAYQLPAWKVMHFNDASKAAQHAETIKKLGCEVKQNQHAGHIDVKYRCANWKSMQVKNHKLADQWSKWLRKSGFDVSHSHTDTAYLKGNEVVQFRLVPWKRVHGDGSANEATFIKQLKRIGCDVRVNKHGGHSDIHFRAPTWRAVRLASHNEADELMAWLKQKGFEVRHEH